MTRLDYHAIVNLASGYAGRVVQLSPFSLAMLTSLASQPERIFMWSELTELERDTADNLVSQAAYELMTGVVPMWCELKHLEPSGGNGGSVVANTWTNFEFNVKSDPSGLLIDDDSTSFQPQAGLYFVEFVTPWIVSNNSVKTMRIRLVSNGISGEVVASSPNINNHLASQSVMASMTAMLAADGNLSYSVQYRANDARADNALGRPLSVAGENEVYASLRLWRIGE